MPEVTSHVAWAGSKILGRGCAKLNSAFLTCKSNDPNPEACASLGLLVLDCGNKTFSKVRKHCLTESTEYRECLDDHRGKFSKCRGLEANLNNCFESSKAVEAEGKDKVAA